VVVGEHTLERQCDPEYINELKDVIGDYDAVISIACGVGPQFLSERYPDTRVFSGGEHQIHGRRRGTRCVVGAVRRLRYLRGA